MGAHHAPNTPSTPIFTAAGVTATGVRVTATAAAAVALTGAGAGLASAHEGGQDSPQRFSTYDDDTTDAACDSSDGGSGGLVDAVAGNALSAAGLSPSDAEGTCADPSSLGSLVPSRHSDDSAQFRGAQDARHSDRSDDRDGSSGSDDRRTSDDAGRVTPAARSQQPSGAAQARPSAGGQHSAVDTPPPPGQTRIIKLPSTR